MIFNSIKRRLIFYFLVVITITVVTITVVSIYQVRQSMLIQSSGNFKKIAQEISFNVGNILNGAERDTQVLSNNQVIISKDTSREEKEEELKKLKDIWGGYYEDIIITDAEGNVVAATDYLYASDWRYQTVFKEAKKGFFSISDIHYVDESLGLVMTFAGPVFDEGVLTGIVALQLNVEKISNIINHLIIGKNGFAFLIDNNNKIISHPNRELVFSKTDQKIINQINEGKEIIEFTESGIDYIGNFSKLRRSDSEGNLWTIVVTQSKKDLLSPITALIKGIGFFVVLLFFSAIFIGLYFSNLIVKPIIKLRDASIKISKGNLRGIKVELKTKDEIGQLAETFNKMAYNIRERNMQLADEKLKNEAILVSIGEGIIATDKNRKIVMANRAAEKMLSLKSAGLAGKKWPEDILDITDEKGNIISLEKMPVWRTLKSGKVSYSSASDACYFVSKKDQSKVPVAITASPVVLNNKTIGAVSVFRDITAEKQVKKLKSEFIPLASHQLRTPLTTIQWVVERLLKVSEKLPKKEKEYLNDINKSTGRLVQLVDDMLNMSRIEEGRIAVTPKNKDVVKIIQDYTEESLPLSKQKGIKLIFKEHPKTLAALTDESAIKHILQTLVSNAMEYTPKKGTVEIILDKKDNSFVMKIKDTGIGIPKKDQPTIFERFTRAANAKLLKKEGTGLGLHIGKQVVELLGGKIWFESAEKKGTTFFVEIPLKLKEIKGEKTFA